MVIIKQHIVFFTGAGISVESGLSTFRGKDGMWNNKDWRYYASAEALYNDPQGPLDFYNWRRRKLSKVEPNKTHKLIAELKKEHKVTVITQNVDNLHERAGNTDVIHIHGEPHIFLRALPLLAVMHILCTRNNDIRNLFHCTAGLGRLSHTPGQRF